MSVHAWDGPVLRWLGNGNYGTGVNRSGGKDIHIGLGLYLGSFSIAENAVLNFCFGYPGLLPTDVCAMNQFLPSALLHAHGPVVAVSRPSSRIHF